jgi:hypothetical protein
VASDFDRDNSIDALLKGAHRTAAAGIGVGAGPVCLDAETLAAWADGGLDGDRVRAIEAHVADCARCQALSAAFFSSDETVAADAPKVVPFRRNPVVYWLPIAAGTIAASLLIWLGVRDRNEVIPQAQAVVSESRAAEPLQGQQGASALAAPRGDVAVPADAKRLQRKEGNAPPVEQRADRAKQEAATANQFRKVVPEPVASPTAKTVAPPPPAVMPPAPQPVSAPPITAQTAPPPPPVATTASGVGAGVAGGAAGGTRLSSTLRETVEPRILAEFSSVLARSSTISGLPPTGAVVGGVAGGGGGQGGRGGGGGGRGAAVAMDAVNVAAPPFYWRILSTDVIERSVDRLKWEPVAIDPPVQGLAGGAAPSATVCWIIGRAGLVLRTTDGKEFTRVTQPALVDLISITAQDALRATVTTVGGQTFSTTDGGKNWK